MADRFVATSEIEAPAAEVFEWHMRPGAFERLVPPWERLRVVERDPEIREGSRVVLEMRAGPVPIRWTAVHRDIVAGRQFCDEQEGGPFRRWRHEHRFVPLGDDRARLEDDIGFELPLGRLGELAGGWQVRRRLARTFRYRHVTTRGDVETHWRYRLTPRLTVGLTGASGLIGSHLRPFLATGGHRVVRLVRAGPPVDEAIAWNTHHGLVADGRAPDLDAVVHLAAANIAARRWTPAWKREVVESRVGPTRRLAESLARLARPPRILVCASATGFYGDRPGETLTEDDGPGRGFLSELCERWEAAAAPAAAAGIRVVLLRLGIVLSPTGGALKRMLPPFLAGMGGPVGDGTTAFSWVAMDDVLGAVVHALGTPTLAGPVNVTAPGVVTSGEFAATLARVLRRPSLIRVPAPVAVAVFGEMADALLLSGARVEPRALLASGFRFRFAGLEEALRHVLGRSSQP